MSKDQEPTTAELRAMAQEAKQWIVDLAAGRRPWRMCIPVQSGDTDIVLMRLYKEFVAALDREAALTTALELGEQTRAGLEAHNEQGRVERQHLQSRVDELEDKLAIEIMRRDRKEVRS